MAMGSTDGRVGDLLDRTREVANGECAGEGELGEGVRVEKPHKALGPERRVCLIDRDNTHVGLLWSGVDGREVGSLGEQRIFFYGTDSNRVWGGELK